MPDDNIKAARKAIRNAKDELDRADEALTEAQQKINDLRATTRSGGRKPPKEGGGN